MLLSFIIPSYHCEAYIGRCLKHKDTDVAMGSSWE